MRSESTIGRLARLAFFVGWGAASLLIEACGGATPAPRDSATLRDSPPADTSVGDASGAPDGGAADAPVADAGVTDGASWDVPLE
jgi:hypothetical protein